MFTDVMLPANKEIIVHIESSLDQEITVFIEPIIIVSSEPVK